VKRVVASALVALWTVGALASTPLAADRVPKIGLVTTSPETRDAFVRGLAELGYRVGQNVELHWRRAAEDGGRDVQELVRLEPACLVLPGPLRLAHGRRLTTTIPITALDLESDPVGGGIVASLARPGGNVTGIFMDLPELAGKQIQLLREAARRCPVSRWCGTSASARPSCRRLRPPDARPTSRWTRSRFEARAIWTARSRGR
jgi:hypothetical protein